MKTTHSQTARRLRVLRYIVGLFTLIAVVHLFTPDIPNAVQLKLPEWLSIVGMILGLPAIYFLWQAERRAKERHGLEVKKLELEIKKLEDIDANSTS